MPSGRYILPGPEQESIDRVKEKISKAVISRLPRYYRYLADLKEENVDRISSNDLAKRMHVTASQIRQDPVSYTHLVSAVIIDDGRL